MIIPKIYREHETGILDLDHQGEGLPSPILFRRKKESGKCASFRVSDGKIEICFSYFVGADWVPGFQNKKSFFVEPKINTKSIPKSREEDKGIIEDDLVKIDILKMLFSALSHPEIQGYTQELYEIKFDQPSISLDRKLDLLSPLLIIQYLSLVKEIVRKGLKRSYYKVEQNLYSKVKGKILVSQTIKQNKVKNRNFHTYCSFDEFGIDGKENRLLKKALNFSQRYLWSFKEFSNKSFFTETYNFIQPAFRDVSDDVDLHDIKNQKFNAFYKEYREAMHLAQLILQRFGYNINAINNRATIPTPPFWIDMSKLFELYVLGLLKDSNKHGSKILYHPTTKGNELDYLLVDGDNSIVIDAKYKLGYKFTSHEGYHEDIRQVSGYARLKNVRQKAGVTNQDQLLDCLIIYPDQEGLESIPEKFKEVEIDAYERVYKVGVKLPTL